MNAAWEVPASNRNCISRDRKYNLCGLMAYGNGVRGEQCLLSFFTSYVYVLLLVRMQPVTETARKMHVWCTGYLFNRTHG
ncbi:unnamed protein product [Boreogadus saida]